MKNIHVMIAIESLCSSLEKVSIYMDQEIDILKQENEELKKKIAGLEEYRKYLLERNAELTKQLDEVKK